MLLKDFPEKKLYPVFHHNAVMTRETLLDFFDERLQSTAEFLIHVDEYRVRRYSYEVVRQRAAEFSGRLASAGVNAGDKVVFWAENRPEWLMAFWGCLLRGAVVVPVDYRASGNFLQKIGRTVNAKVVLVGDDVSQPPRGPMTVWRLAELTTKTPATSTASLPSPHTAARDDVAEIIFTSGATSEPKGVVITHRNILANIVPVEREVLKYRRFGRPFYPLRFLNLLPMSHMFGQALATFVPPMLPGICVFMSSYSPHAIVHQIRSRRISALVCVPKILEILKEHVLQIAPEAAEPLTGNPHVVRRWWHYRRVHSLFGLKFWCFIVGAAPLDPKLEAFWSHLGFLVVQGYGLTETAPIVTLNHPFRTKSGTVGTPIAGVQVKIAEDGEILVKGDNVTSGYFGSAANPTFENGWFHTGDLGALDESGNLQVYGRKKEVIVTSDGLNVFPEDVERVVNGLPMVRESVAIGITRDGNEQLHVVVTLKMPTDPSLIQQAANRELESHQQIRALLEWPGGQLPRTEGTQKLKRGEVQTWVAKGAMPQTENTEGGERSFASILSQVVGQAVNEETPIAELGLSSLERVELLMVLEHKFNVAIDEHAVDETIKVSDLKKIVASHGAGAPTNDSHFPLPTWNQSWLVANLRRVALAVWLLPLTRLFAWITADGLEHVTALPGPVVFAANHQSYIDPSVILAALPRGQRHRVVTAMSKEFFAAHFHPKGRTRWQRFTNSLTYYLATTFYNAFPLPQREAGTRQALRYASELIAAGNSLIIFPEGQRYTGNSIASFQPGAAMLAARLEVPVVPVRLRGVDLVLGEGQRMACPGRVQVRFGPPMKLDGTDYVALAEKLESIVKAL